MSNPKNHEGYLDPTSFAALNKEERSKKRVSNLIAVLKYIARNAGFEIDGRIVLIDRESGEVWR